MRFFYVLFFCCVVSQTVSAQGCSDAGFCSIPYHVTGVAKNETGLKNTLITDVTFGLGEGNTKSFTASVLYRKRFSNRLSLDNKITAAYISGSLGNVLNAGDLFSTVNYKIFAAEKTGVHITGGIKIPLTAANDKEKNSTLPMAYQPSLGTYDLLLGTAWTFLHKIDINAALQLPVINANNNQYFRQPGDNKDFETTNAFRRKADALFRAGYLFETSNRKWNFKPNALAIIHLGEDSYLNSTGQRINIDGSSGLTLNMNLQSNYVLSKNRSLGFSIATPLIVRKTRPDGLTRSLTVGINYQFNF